MKRATAALLVLVLIGGGASLAYGQSFAFGPKFGYAIATGDLGDVADDGFAYGLYGDYFINSATSLEFSFLRHTHDTGANAGSLPATPDDLVDDFFSISDGDVEINEFTVSGVHRFATGKVTPYVTAGGGVYLTQINLKGMKEEVSTSVSTDTETGPTGTTTGTRTDVTKDLVDFAADDTLTDFGVRGGGGVSIMLTGELSLGAEAVYTYVFGDLDSGIVNVLGLVSYAF